MVLNLLIQSFIEHQKKKDQKKESITQTNDDDDVMIDQQNSDDENAEDEATNPESPAYACNQLVEILAAKLDTISDVLNPEQVPGSKIASSIDDEEFVPLGRQRLITVEAVHKMLKLRKEPISEALMKSQVFKHIIELVKRYPWNNFLQLKVINICDLILDDGENEELRKFFLQSSGIGPAIIEMSKQASYTMQSERVIRNGYMALVVKVSNKILLKGNGNKQPEGETGNGA